jgi:hypothetical protein
LIAEIRGYILRGNRLLGKIEITTGLLGGKYDTKKN